MGSERCESRRTPLDELHQDGVIGRRSADAVTIEPERQRLRLAEAINIGQGLGSGLTGVLGLSSATYRGASVVSKLRPSGDIAEFT